MSEPSLPIERIRQPLTAIMGRLDLVEATLDLDDPKEHRAALQIDLDALRQAASLLATWCNEAEKAAKKDEASHAAQQAARMEAGMTNCGKPDRDVPRLVCGYPLPCPHHGPFRVGVLAIAKDERLVLKVEKIKKGRKKS